MSCDFYLTKQVLRSIKDMYELEEAKIRQDLYAIQTRYQDKHIVTEKILEYIRDNINIIWDVINNKNK